MVQLEKTTAEKYGALFMEADGGLSLEAQEALPELLGLPDPTFTIWTGGKSLHLYWCAKEGGSLSPLAWRKAQERLIAAVEAVAPDAGVDRSIKDPSRVMRAPGSIHPATGERCRIHSESGKRYDLAALAELLPPLPEEALMGDPSIPSLDRLPVLREGASELELPLRDGELTKLLWQARRNLSAPAEALGAGDLLDFTPTPWLWEGLLMREAVNLVVALPKVGKTSLMLEAISSWHRGEAFLGRKFHGECPPVLIVGSDQPQSDWGRMLQKVGLVSENRRLLEPIVGLFHSGAPLALDPEGIERIASYAKKYPGLLVVIDSYARCVASLGLSERDAEIAEPLADLQEALGSSSASVVVIHHSNKSSRNESASLASRGSTALPAACSQILLLQRLEAPEGGQQSPLSGKRMLSTEGRGGAPEKFLLELSEEGRWLCRGDGDALLREEERQRAVGALNDRQASALEHVEEVWESTEGRQGISADLLASLMELRGADTSRAARRLLDQLVQRGLVRKRVQSEGKDRALVARYVPTSANLQSMDSTDRLLALGADGKDGPDGPAHKREGVSAPLEVRSTDSPDQEETVSVFDSVEVWAGIDPIQDGISEVRLLDFMGNSLSVVNDARQSFEKASVDWSEKDAKLLNYLAREHHTSPFRGVVFKWFVKAPLFIARQWWKHTVACTYVDDQLGWNEKSYRYCSAEGAEFYMPSVFLQQSESNRQASADPLSDAVQKQARLAYASGLWAAKAAYEDLLTMGVSKEQARAVLPPAMYTSFVWTCSLQALLHFISLRQGAGAQGEIVAYADALFALGRPVAPEAFDAFAANNYSF